MPDLYVPLDANYPDDDRFLALQSPFAELLAIRSFALCKRLRSDGFVHERQAWKLAADFIQYVDVMTVFRELEVSGLWKRMEDGWLVPSWAKHNKTRADMEAEREAETARKRAWREARRGATDSPEGHNVATRDARDTFSVPEDPALAELSATPSDRVEGESERQNRRSGLATECPTGQTHATRSNTEQSNTEVGRDPALAGEAPSKPSRKKPATRAPESFDVTGDLREWAATRGVNLVDLDSETERFLDHHRAKGSTFSDWRAAWRTWMNRAQQYAQERQGRTVPARSNGRIGIDGEVIDG